MRGAPRPAGRISNSRCGAFVRLVWPIRPSVVPPRTRAPLTSRLVTKSFGFRPSGAPAEGSSRSSPPSTSASPPTIFAALRSGWANRRTLATGAAIAGATVSAAFASAGASCSVVVLRRRLDFLDVRFLGAG